MTEPLEIRRRPAPQHLRMLAVRVGMLVLGVALLGAGSAALLTQDLAQDDRITALFLVAAGGFGTGLGALQTLRGRALASRMVIVRLDDEGVHVRSGAIERPSWHHLAWEDLREVVAEPVVADHAWVEKGQSFTVLRFVPTSDDRVRGEEPDAQTRLKSTTLGISPVAATLAALQGRTSAFRVPIVLEWVRRHHPEVPVEDRTDIHHGS